MTTDPKRSPQDPDETQDETVSEAEANPTPPATDASTAEDVHDTPQLPTRPDVADQ